MLRRAVIRLRLLRRPGCRRAIRLRRRDDVAIGLLRRRRRAVVGLCLMCRWCLCPIRLRRRSVGRLLLMLLRRGGGAVAGVPRRRLRCVPALKGASEPRRKLVAVDERPVFVHVGDRKLAVDVRPDLPLCQRSAATAAWI